MNNVMVFELSRDKFPEDVNNRIVIEDNVGESIHMHLRNVRLEMSIKDYKKFVAELQEAAEVLENGDR